MSLFRIHAQILDDIRSDGLMHTLIAKTDEVVTRFTAGLIVEEIRSVLSGDPHKREPANHHVRRFGRRYCIAAKSSDCDVLPSSTRGELPAAHSARSMADWPASSRQSRGRLSGPGAGSSA